MDRQPRASLFLPLVISLMGACLPLIASAQDSAPAMSDLPPLESLRARLETGEAAAAAAPDDEGAAEVRDGYRDAVGFLEQAGKNEALEESYREALTSAPEEANSVQAELDALPQPGKAPADLAGLPRNAEASVVAERLTRERAILAEKKNGLAELEKKASEQETRPGAIREGKLEAQRVLNEAEASLAKLSVETDAAESAKAGRILLLAKERAAQSELAMLEQEELSSAVRANLLDLQLKLATRQEALAEARVAALTARQDLQSKRDVNQAAMAAEQAGLEAEGQDPAVQKLAQELADLSAELEKVALGRATAGETLAEKTEAMENLVKGYERLRTQLKIGGVSGAFGQIILEESRQLPNLRKERSALNFLEERIGEARIGAFHVEEALSLDVPVEVDRILAESSSVTGSERQQLRVQIEGAFAERGKVLEKLRKEYELLIRDLGELDLVGRQYVDKVAEVSVFMEEKRLWVRSAEVIGVETITDLPAALHWLAAPERALQLGRTLVAVAKSNPILESFLGLILILIFAARRRIKAALELTGQRIKRVSTDRYAYTIKALLLTLLLAVPLPLLVYILGTQILLESADSDWLRGLGGGVVLGASQLIAVCFAWEISRPKGLAQAHFGWGEESMRCFRVNLRRIVIAYVPGAVIYVMLVSQEHIGYLDSLGRVLLIGVMAWVMIFFTCMLRPAKGMFAESLKKRAGSWAARLYGVSFAVLIAVPALLAVLAAVGYPLTAFVLTKEFRIMIEAILAGTVIYALLLRWFTMRGRKLALAERLHDWAERAETAAAEARDGEQPPDEVPLPDLEEEALDFATVGEQTRRMLRFFVGVGVAVVIWFSWSDVIPAFQFLENVSVVGDVSLAALIVAGMIMIATVTTVRNLPGILDVAVLRHLPIDAGARYAATTLCQYAIIIIGFFFVFGIIDLDWSQFGWIAAALSVGLGFGLQETVANFVCGIILLFERPVRIGDVVTVAGTTGTVSRIRMRATTITNWDRQEFIVPNKEFVTGTLLNWTLSSTLNRIIVTVGVAYSSDTVRVRQLIQEIVEQQENVLDDPAPLVTFDQFADSTLNFTIRAYIPNLDHRLATVDALHHGIHRRFAQEGIEIAFPQRDLHLRSVDPSIGIVPGAAPAPANGEGGKGK